MILINLRFFIWDLQSLLLFSLQGPIKIILYIYLILARVKALYQIEEHPVDFPRVWYQG